MPLPTEDLKRRLETQQWTSHNIRLNDELTTLPNAHEFVETDLRLRAIERVLRLFYGEDLSPLRIADLGSLEGGFALALAQKGASILGLEARSANFEKLALLENHFNLPNMKFVLSDVKAFTPARFGMFDVVLALGILYHLDEPVQWLRQIAQATRRLIVIDSHFAPADREALKRLQPELSALSNIETVQVEGVRYEGRWFTEYGPQVDPEPQLWASYSNRRSFWLTKASLLRAVRDAGFDLVFEQHDYSADQHDEMNFLRARTMLIGVKRQ